jgi:hypothetical protein
MLQRDAANGEPNRFITLTSKYRPDEMTPSEAAQELVHAWRMVIQRGKREGIIKDMQYIAVFELTKQGWPHMHILARCSWLAQSWLSDRMAEYAESPRVDIRLIKSKARAAWYVAKYTSKAPEKFEGCKRYWRTLGYDLSPGKTDKPVHDHFQGYLDYSHILDVASLYEAHNYQLEWTSDHSFIAAPQGIDFWAYERKKHQEKQLKPYKDKAT